MKHFAAAAPRLIAAIIGHAALLAGTSCCSQSTQTWPQAMPFLNQWTHTCIGVITQSGLPTPSGERQLPWLIHCFFDECSMTFKPLPME